MASNSSETDDSATSDWLDVSADEEQLTFVSLFGEDTFSSLTEMTEHCKEHHGFDLAGNINRLKLDFHGSVKLINFVRHCVKEKLALPVPVTHGDFDEDRYLQPALENDAVIFSLDEILEIKSDHDDGAELSSDKNSQRALLSRNKELEAEIESLQTRFAAYRQTVQETLDRRWGDENTPKTAPVVEKDRSEYYFESYAEYDIHETMLKDQVRTDAYRDFIYDNKNLFQNKVVLDIGCGTGILSMFCAKAGAKLVIAVDKSDIIVKARENVFNNGLSDKITCLRGAIEDVVLPVDKVDIIVSEWMGYCLLYEAMLPSVLFARDKYLQPDGILAPSSATLWIAPTGDTEHTSDHITYWRDVYGFDMKAMQEGIYDDVRILSTPKDALCGTPFPFKTIDLRSVKANDLTFAAKWESVLTRDTNSVDGFVIWFDNFFTTSANAPMPSPESTPAAWPDRNPGSIAFTTGPFGTDTHWHQGRLLIRPNESIVKAPNGTKMNGEISFSALEQNARALTIQGNWSVAEQSSAQTWTLK